LLENTYFEEEGMPNPRIRYLIPIFLGALLIAGFFLFLNTTRTSAQCGSQASSCKNCHETQAQDPVNNDGTAWHTSHAFGDFCYICHGGNSQTTDKTQAHTGMVAPLSDIKAACQQCHPNDLEARAQVYATALGVEIGSGTVPTTTVSASATATPASTGSAASAPVTTALNVDDPNVVNYTQRYDEIVLGQHPVNWGNVILIAMIGMLVVGGGGFVITNEKLVKVSFGDTKKVEGEYPSDVVDMLPAIARLKSQTRKSLKSILDNPKKTEKVLDLIDEVISDKKTEE
jgi:hypothetical protein